MSKKLVVYFSASGITKKVAQLLADTVKADIFEICQETKYTEADLDWRDRNSRSTVEMNDPNCRPAIVGAAIDMSTYDQIFIGFPIWWGREPSVVDTFIDSCNFTGKTVVPFCTSGSSGFGNTAQRLRTLLPGSTVTEGIKFSPDVSAAELISWAQKVCG